MTLGTIRDQYLQTHQGTLAPTTLASMTIHLKHAVRTLGEARELARNRP